MDRVQLTMLGRLIYKLFLRKVLKKAVSRSSNTIDDVAFQMVEEVAFGTKKNGAM